MTKQFTHGGSAGDTIYHLACIKDMGGGELYLNLHAHPHWRMPEDRCRSLISLFEHQPYLSKVDVSNHVVGKDLDNWRRHWRVGCNLSDMCSSWLGIDHTPRRVPWLTVPKGRQIAKVVIHRSPRYHNGRFPWWDVVEKYGRDLVFVGHPDEHCDFVQRFGPVSYYYTRSYLELAQVIDAAWLFIGNQSSPAAIAEGLKCNKILESVEMFSWCWNCHWDRPGCQTVEGGDVDLLSLDDMSFKWNDVWDYSLVSPDRLGVIARLVRETADLPGDMAELGVFRGGSARVMADACPKKTLHLFDTFTGLPCEGERKGQYSFSHVDVEKYLLGRNVQLHVGFFPATASPDLGPFSFVHLDGDLYESTRDALSYFLPRMSKGGVIVFDDVGQEPGVDQAIQEVGIKIEKLAPKQGVYRCPT